MNATAPLPPRDETPRPPPRRHQHARRAAPRPAPVRVHEPAPSAFERHGVLLVLAFFVVSVLIHTGGWVGANYLGLLTAQRPPPPPRKIEVAVVEKKVEPPKPPEPEPPKPPEPPKAKPPPKLVKPPPKPLENLPPPPPDAPPPPPDMPPAPPPPNAEAAKPTATPIPIAGISFSSTSTNGSFAVSTGNTLYGAPQQKAVDPKDVKPYKAERYAPAYKLTEMPRIKYQPDFDEMSREYPDEAKRNEIEGQVKARITVDDDGSVVKVVVLSSPGYGLDAAAKKLLARFRFHPAKENGQPVATEIDYTFTFELPY